MIKKRRKIKKKVLIILATFIILFSGILTYSYCYDPIEDLVENKKEEIKVEEETEEEAYVKPSLNIVDEDSTSRPYAVMINNISAARPYHSGLQEAYIVYEIIVEGGITRYMALFKDQTNEVIGSVRSSRHYFLDYVMENDAFYVHWGWSPQAQEDITTYNIDNINGLYYEGTYFYRENINISYEHTGYTKMSMLDVAVEKLNYRTETNKDLLFEYDSESIDYGEVEQASNIDISYSTSLISNFEYDEENQYYLMSINSIPHVDYITDLQYHFKNIITYQIANNVMAGETTRQEIHNIGSGEGYYFSNGEVIEITWEKTSREAQTVYKVASTGEKLVVNDGNTYIGIQPVDQNLSLK
ncbi:MAG: DUF3048 domain-containing protein [bacterium]